MIIKENISQFQRSQNSKKSLGIGIKEINKNISDLKKNIRRDLKPYGINVFNILTVDLKPSVIVFKISDSNYEKKFQGEFSNLSKLVERWIDDNTFLDFEQLRKNNDGSWSIDVYDS